MKKGTSNNIMDKLIKFMRKETKISKKKLHSFIRESNAIEMEYSEEAFEGALMAWEYLKEQSKLSVDTILIVHFLLMKRLRPDIAGKFRTCDVWIGGKRKHFISVQLIEEDINNFLLGMGTSPQLKKEYLEDFVKKSHIDFEAIHPHEDGNGRVGRLIYQWHRMKLGLPIHIIHADIGTGGNEQRSYYGWFRD